MQNKYPFKILQVKKLFNQEMSFYPRLKSFTKKKTWNQRRCRKIPNTYALGKFPIVNKKVKLHRDLLSENFSISQKFMAALFLFSISAV